MMVIVVKGVASQSQHSRRFDETEVMRERERVRMGCSISA